MGKATYLLKKAGELVRETRYEEAVEACLQATEADPADSRAWFGLGVIGVNGEPHFIILDGVVVVF